MNITLNTTQYSLKVWAVEFVWEEKSQTVCLTHLVDGVRLPIEPDQSALDSEKRKLAEKRKTECEKIRHAVLDWKVVVMNTTTSAEVHQAPTTA